MDEINTQMAAQAMAVQIWINWMTLCFFASLVFIRRRPGARLALAAMLLTMVTAMGIFAIEPNVHLFGLAHLIFWGPLLVYLLRVEVRRPGFSWRGAYGIWVGLLSTTIAISLVFDVRDLFLVAAGQK